MLWRRGAPVRILCNHRQFNKAVQICIRKLKFVSTFKKFNQNSNQKIRIKKFVFISVLHLITLSGRCRVGFGVGNISNTIEHSILGTDPGYLNSEPPQYIPVAT